MTMLEEIGPLLDNQFSWLLLPSTAVAPEVGNLTYEEMPEDPDQAVSLAQYDGGEPMRTMGTTMYENLRLQILIRDPQTEVAKQRLYDIWLFLERYNVTINATNYAVIEALGSPIEVGPDAKDRQRFSQNYRVWRQVR